MEPHNENPYESPLAESKPSVAGDDLASRGTRLGAAIIDGIIGMVIALPIMFVSGYFARAAAQEVSIVEGMLYSFGGFGFYLLLHGYLLATRGQSIGKYVLGIKIVDYDTSQLISLGKIIGLRLLPVWLLSLIPFVNCLGIVDVLFIFGEERRCVHDLIAGTKVVQA